VSESPSVQVVSVLRLLRLFAANTCVHWSEAVAENALSWITKGRTQNSFDRACPRLTAPDLL
jgi:hypothetical protein